ncbi:integral membrane protein [Paracoccidioides lutzii Pb01]|uniref:Integral membrane protein n=1 Tax=Paracoccidioides lutzii (strain ATCC MYA-826 / Pb01) TaxID=502779 RepID=C1H2D1_PARBA|nr:integral membrane protein [Paracoccidioides lutzii Pb01]EEH33711.2 integral membrane protein [Paracoccidioides lutzii Pb01]
MPPNLLLSVSLFRVYYPSWPRIGCPILGAIYSFTILVAVIAIANHFVLDAFAEAVVCGLGWRGNPIPVNLFPLEDYLFYLLKTHKPEQGPLYPYVHSPLVCEDADENYAGMPCVDVFSVINAFFGFPIGFIFLDLVYGDSPGLWSLVFVYSLSVQPVL